MKMKYKKLFCEYCKKAFEVKQSSRQKFCSSLCSNNSSISKTYLFNGFEKIPPGKSGVYKIFCSATNTSYIGSSSNIRARVLAHSRALEEGRHINKYLQNSWNKYGRDSFSVSILKLTKSCITEEEKEINEHLNKGESLFNVELSPTDKRGENNAFYGKKHTDEIKKRLSFSHKTISDADAGILKCLLDTGLKLNQCNLADRFKVSESTVSDIKTGTRRYSKEVKIPDLVVVTGSQGFISRYLVQHLLDLGYVVIGIDNYSKYGRISREHDFNKGFYLLEMDLAEQELPLIKNAKYIIANAALIGGIRLFHDKAFDIIDQNERILSNTFRTAIKLHKDYSLKKIITLSSSMVFESTSFFPTSEDVLEKCKPPISSYGRQKLMVEWWTDAAHKQYGLPYTIVRPFNCVGIGEEDYRTGYSHVLPDLVWKCMSGLDPLPIMGDGSQVRCYTDGKDIARGIVMAMESGKALNNDFNISNPIPTSVLELAKLVWSKINPEKPFSYITSPSMDFDVQKRIPDVSKARDLLGFKAQISLEDSVDEVIDWMQSNGCS